MSNEERVGILYDRVGTLLGVKYSIFDAGPDGLDWIDAIEFTFTGGSFATVYAESDFDTVRLELEGMVSRDGCYIRDVTEVAPWMELIGGRLTWIWVLTNQQGYQDGLRLEFSFVSGGVVTLLVIASGIQIYSSERIPLNLPRDSR